MKTLTEKQTMKIFNRHKKEMIWLLGDQVTDNQTLETIGIKLLGSKFKGVYAVDKVPIKTPGLYIINNDISTGPGEHWVSLKITQRTIYIFDSFGRKSTTLLKILSKKATKLNKKIVDSDYDTEQGINEMICGQQSLAWLLVVKMHGIKNALKI